MATDRRIQYTLKIIKETFLVLLNDHHIEDISVKVLCEQADINRATFYRHYKDIYDLFEQIEKELFDDISLNAVQDIIEVKVLTNIYNHQGFYKEFFHSNLPLSWIKEHNLFCDAEERKKAEKQDGFDAAKFKYSFNFFVYGVRGLLQDWIENGCIESPEEFAKILKEITNSN